MFELYAMVRHRPTGVMGLVIKANAHNALLEVEGRERGYPVSDLELVDFAGGGDETPSADAEPEPDSKNVPRPQFSLRDNVQRGTLSPPVVPSNTAIFPTAFVDSLIDNTPALAADDDASGVYPQIESEARVVLQPIPPSGLTQRQLAARLRLSVQAISRWHSARYDGSPLKAALLSRNRDPEGIAWMLFQGRYHPINPPKEE